jgi:hypothetical protein
VRWLFLQSSEHEVGSFTFQPVIDYASDKNQADFSPVYFTGACAASGAAPIPGSFNLLLTANKESTDDLWRPGLQIVFSREPKSKAGTEFRVQAGQSGFDHRRILSFGAHKDELEGEAQTLFLLPVKRASFHPPIDSVHIPGTADVGCEFHTISPRSCLTISGSGSTMRSKIRARCGIIDLGTSCKSNTILHIKSR